jgi:mono/diheme cytochrome c family protein
MNPRLPTAICLVMLALLVAASAVLAWKRNSGGAAPPVPAAQAATPVGPEPAQVARGRALYAEQGCASCHAIAGAGNPRHPLDGVGSRWQPAELQLRITGTGSAATEMAASVVRRKQRYSELGEDDLSALTAYLAALRSTP